MTTLRHPAIRAWQTLSGDSCVPQVEDVKRAHTVAEPLGRKLVSRLTFEGRRPDVIAKFGRSGSVHKERQLYERILGKLPVRTPCYVGGLDEEDGCWIFLEVISGRPAPHASQTVAHMRASWLATLHATASDLGNGCCLPSSGLESGMRRTERILRRARSGVPTDGIRSVTELVERIAETWQLWDIQNETLMPTLVHGDFVLKNSWITNEAGRVALVVFDWGKAAWGPPLADLAGIDMGAYRNALDRYGTSASIRSLEHASALGRVVRFFAAIDWQLASWPHAWTVREEANLDLYAEGLSRACAALGMELRAND